MEVDEKAVAKSDELNKNEASENMDTSTPDFPSPSEEKGIGLETSGLRCLLISFLMSVTENGAFQLYVLWACYRGI